MCSVKAIETRKGRRKEEENKGGAGTNEGEMGMSGGEDSCQDNRVPPHLESAVCFRKVQVWSTQLTVSSLLVQLLPAVASRNDHINTLRLQKCFL